MSNLWYFLSAKRVQSLFIIYELRENQNYYCPKSSSSYASNFTSYVPVKILYVRALIRSRKKGYPYFIPTQYVMVFFFEFSVLCILKEGKKKRKKLNKKFRSLRNCKINSGYLKSFRLHLWSKRYHIRIAERGQSTYFWVNILAICNSLVSR